MLAVIAALRVGLADLIVDDPTKALWPDSDSYMTPAQQWLAGAGYSDPGGTDDLYRPPVYPFYLAVHQYLFGDMIVPTVVTQLLLGAGVAALLYAIGRLVWAERVGFAAALAYLLTPNAALWALGIMSDTLYTFLVTCALACIIAYALTRRVGWCAAAGILAGLGVLARPIGSVMIVLWAAFILLAGASRLVSWKHSAAAACMFLTAAAAVVVPWMARNARVYGLFTVSPISTWNLGRYVAPYALAADEGISLEDARTKIPTTHIPQPGERERYLSVILDHPVGFLKAYARGTWYVLSEVNQPNLAQLLDEHSTSKGILTALQEGGVRAAWERALVILGDPRMRWTATLPWLFRAFQLAVYVLAIRTVLTRFGRSPVQPWFGWLLALSCLGFLFIPGPVGTCRFRLPADPMLALLAALGVFLPRRLRMQQLAGGEPGA